MDGHDLSYWSNWTKRRKIEATVVRNMESLRRRVLESNSTDILSPMLPTGHEGNDCDLDEDAVYVDASACSDNYLVSVEAIDGVYKDMSALDSSVGFPSLSESCDSDYVEFDK